MSTNRYGRAITRGKARDAVKSVKYIVGMRKHFVISPTLSRCPSRLSRWTAVTREHKTTLKVKRACGVISTKQL